MIEERQLRSRVSGKEEADPSPRLWRRLGVWPHGTGTPSLWVTPNNILWKAVIGPAMAWSPTSWNVSWLSGPRESYKSQGYLSGHRKAGQAFGLRHLPTPTLTSTSIPIPAPPMLSGCGWGICLRIHLGELGLFLIFIYLFYMYWCFACIHILQICMWCPQRPEEYAVSPYHLELELRTL